MIKLFSLITFFFILNISLIAQSQQVIIKGTVISDDTMQPLPFAHIIIDSTGTTSNIYGGFTIAVRNTDTLHFSYIGYQRKSIIASKLINMDGKNEEVILLKDITFLRSVTITSLPESLSDLKEELLATEVPIAKEIENAKKSIDIATYQYLYMKSFKLKMNAYDNHTMFMKGNEGLNPSGGNVKGLLKLLKNSAQGKPLEGTYEHYKYYQKKKGQ